MFDKLILIDGTQYQWKLLTSILDNELRKEKGKKKVDLTFISMNYIIL